MAKVSKTKIDAIIKHTSPAKQSYLIDLPGGKTVEITMDPNITYENFVAAAHEYADLQFAIDNATGKEVYAPHIEPFASWYVMLKYFTDVDTEIADTNGKVNMRAVERLWALRQCHGFREKLADVIGTSWTEIDCAGFDLVHLKNRELQTNEATVWKKLDALLDQAQAQFERFSTEDMQSVVDGMKKLADVDDGKIVQFLNTLRD